MEWAGGNKTRKWEKKQYWWIKRVLNIFDRHNPDDITVTNRPHDGQAKQLSTLTLQWVFLRVFKTKPKTCLSHKTWPGFSCWYTCTSVSPHFAIPAQRQVLGVVDDLVVLVFALALAELLLLLFLALLSRPGLFPLDVLMSQLPLLL